MEQVIKPCRAVRSLKLAVALCLGQRPSARLLSAILCSLAVFASSPAHAILTCTAANIGKTLTKYQKTPNYFDTLPCPAGIRKTTFQGEEETKNSPKTVLCLIWHASDVSVQRNLE